MRLSRSPRLFTVSLLLAASACAPENESDEPDDGAMQLDASVLAVDASEAQQLGSDAGPSAMLDAASPRPVLDGGVADSGRSPRPDASASSDASPEPARDAGRDAGVLGDASVSDASMRDAGGMTPDGACPAHGSVSYMLQQKSAPSSAESMAYTKIRMAMDKAIEKYNCYTSLSRQVNVTYDPSVQTADGSTGGTIRFGSDASMHFVTAMHELGHVFGVGSNQFKPLVKDGVFTGQTATAEMRRIENDPIATVKSDGTHFWPYGLNYVSEYKSEADLVGHCAIVVAIRKDLGM